MSRRLLSAAGFAVFTIALRRGRLGDMLPAVLVGGVLSVIVALIVLAATGSRADDPGARHGA